MIIQCPECGFERTIDADIVPAGSEFATCPQCATRFRFRIVPAEPQLLRPAPTRHTHQARQEKPAAPAIPPPWSESPWKNAPWNVKKEEKPAPEATERENEPVDAPVMGAAGRDFSRDSGRRAFDAPVTPAQSVPPVSPDQTHARHDEAGPKAESFVPSTDSAKADSFADAAGLDGFERPEETAEPAKPHLPQVADAPSGRPEPGTFSVFVGPVKPARLKDAERGTGQVETAAKVRDLGVFTEEEPLEDDFAPQLSRHAESRPDIRPNVRPDHGQGSRMEPGFRPERPAVRAPEPQNRFAEGDIWDKVEEVFSEPYVDAPYDYLNGKGADEITEETLDKYEEEFFKVIRGGSVVAPLRDQGRVREDFAPPADEKSGAERFGRETAVEPDRARPAADLPVREAAPERREPEYEEDEHFQPERGPVVERPVARQTGYAARDAARPERVQAGPDATDYADERMEPAYAQPERKPRPAVAERDEPGQTARYVGMFREDAVTVPGDEGGPEAESRPERRAAPDLKAANTPEPEEVRPDLPYGDPWANAPWNTKGRKTGQEDETAVAWKDDDAPGSDEPRAAKAQAPRDDESADKEPARPKRIVQDYVNIDDNADERPRYRTVRLDDPEDHERPGDGAPPWAASFGGGKAAPGEDEPKALLANEGSVPWEYENEFPRPAAFARTLVLIFAQPVQFFGGISRLGSVIPSLLFALLFLLLETLVLASKVQVESVSADGVHELTSLLSFFGIPLVILGGIVGLTGLLFFVAWLINTSLKFMTADAKFNKTFKIVAYANAALLLAVIPFIGGILSSLLTLAFLLMGVKNAYRLTWGQTMLAVAPYLLYCITINVQFWMLLRSAGAAVI